MIIWVIFRDLKLKYYLKKINKNKSRIQNCLVAQSWSIFTQIYFLYLCNLWKCDGHVVPLSFSRWPESHCVLWAYLQQSSYFTATAKDIIYVQSLCSRDTYTESIVQKYTKRLRPYYYKAFISFRAVLCCLFACHWKEKQKTKKHLALLHSYIHSKIRLQLSILSL